MSQALINRLLAARESWFEIEPGRRVKLRRPPEVDMPKLVSGVTLDLLASCTVDWEGFTEADLLGVSVGSDTIVPFSADVWKLALADRSKWFAATSGELLRLVTEHLQSKGLVAKN